MLFEVLVVVALLALIAVMILPRLAGSRRSPRIDCVNNLKQIGLAHQIWAAEKGGKYPMEVSVTNGGTMGLADGRNVWINYFVLSNELSTPRLLVCPVDTKHQPAATNFSWKLLGHISYFVGLDASTSNPQSWLAGDDNFALDGVPVKSGLLVLSPNSNISWTKERHDRCGNLAMADGNVQQLSNSGLTNRLHQSVPFTNRLAIP